MLNEEGKDIRIIDLPDADQVEPGFYVPVDTYAGTKKYDLYDVTNEVDKAVDYVSTVSAQIEGKADKSELDGLEDQIAGKADAAVVYTKDEVDGLLEAKVDSAGSPEWNTNVFIANYYQTPFADILAAKNRGAIILLLMPTPNMYGPLMTLFNMTDTFAYFTAVSPGTTSSPSNLWTVEVSTDGTTDTWSSPIVNKCAQLGSITIETDSSPVKIGGLNNYLGTMSLNRSSFTLIVEVDDGEVVNFGLEIENSQSCQLTIQKKVGNTITTLKHSVAAGNTLAANKTYQVTAVGNCWTLAEFEA